MDECEIYFGESYWQPEVTGDIGTSDVGMTMHADGTCTLVIDQSPKPETVWVDWKDIEWS